MTMRVSTSSRSDVDAGVGLGGAAAALEGERARDNADGQRAERAGDLRDDGRAAGAGAAALARGDEDHVGAPQRLLDLVGVVLGGLLAGLRRVRRQRRGPRVNSRPTSSLTSASDIRSACASVLTAMNSTPLEPGLDHAVDGVHAAAPDAHHLDHRQVVLRCCHDTGLPLGLNSGSLFEKLST
jgi:hypothetical protein